MTNRRRSATTRSVPAQTSEQLLELTQEHIRPLIGLIDRLSEAGAEDELRVISKQLTRLSFRAQPPPSGISSPKSRSARHWGRPPDAISIQNDSGLPQGSAGASRAS
jgi:hypothetical protein